jgi:cell division protein ZapA
MSETVTVKIEINGVVYPVSCMSGEEDRLIKSSKEVNQVIAGLANISKNVGETRLLAMTSLILADKLNEQYNTEDKNKYYNQMNDLVSWLEKATERMNKVAKLLENK